MATTTQKGSKSKKAKLRRRVVKKSPVTQRPTNAELRQQLAECLKQKDATAIENARLFRELTDALEQQTATSEILRVIASSLTNLQPLLDTMAENAAKLCDATDAVIFRVDNDLYKPAASYGSVPVPERDQSRPIGRDYVPGRAMIDRQTIHLHDLATEPEDDLPAPHARSLGVRTILATPLLREGVPIGAIMIRRLEVRSFSEKQIALLKTFADQAVIAIENVRLFKELEDRNQQLTETLEQQTATSEILGVIASSPTNIQPVLDVVAENAARLCQASNSGIWRTDGENYWLVASHGPVPIPGGESVRPMTRSSNVARSIIDRETLHTPD